MFLKVIELCFLRYWGGGLIKTKGVGSGCKSGMLNQAVAGKLLDSTARFPLALCSASLT